jgi:hypothetical protein
VAAGRVALAGCRQHDRGRCPALAYLATRDRVYDEILRVNATRGCSNRRISRRGPAAAISAQWTMATRPCNSSGGDEGWEELIAGEHRYMHSGTCEPWQSDHYPTAPRASLASY